MAELVFFSGTMDCGKSTLALQLEHNHAARGRVAVIFTRNDRAGAGVISSRLGLAVPAVEVSDALNFWAELVRRASSGQRVDLIICDEAQFYSPDQVEQLARIVDEMDVDVFAFGIATDFRTRLFPGSQRFLELADRVEVLPVRALCWCGRTATHNARVIDGEMVTEGEQVVVGDTAAVPEPAEPDPPPGRPAADQSPRPQQPGRVDYEVLCRRHHRRRQTAQAARAAAISADVLPFGSPPGESTPQPR